MKLRDALGAAPGSKAYNPREAWGYAASVTATRLDDGRVHLSAYKMEGDWFEKDYADVDVAGSALYVEMGADEDQDGMPINVYWDGPDEWQPNKK